MRLIIQLNHRELLSGKPLVLGLTGADQITIHLDPEEIEETIKPKQQVTVRPAVAEEEAAAEEAAVKEVVPKWICDHCGKHYKSKKSLSRHEDWTKRKNNKLLQQKRILDESNGLES